jgi:hypothetical protein
MTKTNLSWFGLMVLCTVSLASCNQSNEQVSSDYKKLAPSEADKRLEHVQELRGKKKPGSPP